MQILPKCQIMITKMLPYYRNIFSWFKPYPLLNAKGIRFGHFEIKRLIFYFIKCATYLNDRQPQQPPQDQVVVRGRAADRNVFLSLVLCVCASMSSTCVRVARSLVLLIISIFCLKLLPMLFADDPPNLSLILATCGANVLPVREPVPQRFSPPVLPLPSC